MVVADRGLFIATDLEAQRDAGIESVIAERLRCGTAPKAPAGAGRRKHVTRHLEVWEIATEVRERFLVCRNLGCAAEDARLRNTNVQRLQVEIAAGSVADQLKNSARRYLKLTGATPEIDLREGPRGRPP